MKNLDDLDCVVRDTLQEFLDDDFLFTGLDVSNKVKETLPFARHSKVSDLVRQYFVSIIEPSGYAKTPIKVTLKDGSVRTALLYHPLADAWDLDAKYDDQKRAQVSVKRNAPSCISLPANVSSDGKITIAAPYGLRNLTPVAPTTASSAWAQMFNSQPSLFPRK